MNHIGIDVNTCSKAKMIRALARLKSTHSVEDGGVYHADAAFSVVRLRTDWTESQVDEWACRVDAGSGYVGTFELL